jgi:hypothetical protein
MPAETLGFVPVDQTTFGRGKGDCFAASIASITGVPLDDLRPRLGIGSSGTWEGDVWVPNPNEEDWFTRATRVMREYGWEIAYETADAPPGLSVACGLANRGLRHAVVAMDGRTVHDPHPSRDGLIEADSWIILARSSPLTGPQP